MVNWTEYIAILSIELRDIGWKDAKLVLNHPGEIINEQEAEKRVEKLINEQITPRSDVCNMKPTYRLLYRNVEVDFAMDYMKRDKEEAEAKKKTKNGKENTKKTKTVKESTP